MTADSPAPSSLRPHVRPCLVMLLLMAGTGLVFVASMLGVASLGGAAQFIQRDQPPNTFEAHAQFVMNYALDTQAYNDVIFLGDSTCLEGVQPILFQQLTGLRAYNLGSVGLLGFDGLQIVLRSYLQHHPAPRVLVLCVHPAIASTPISRWGPVEIHDRFIACYAAPDAARTAQARQSLVEVIRHGARLTYFVASFGANAFENALVSGGPRTYAQLSREVVEGRGYWGVTNVMTDGLKREDIPGYPFIIPADNRRGIASMVRLAQANAITVMIRFTPLPLEGRHPAQDPMHSWSSGLAQACPDAIISQPEMLLYDRSRFADLMHPNRNGSADLTVYLAAQIRQLFSAPAPTPQSPSKEVTRD